MSDAGSEARVMFVRLIEASVHVNRKSGNLFLV